ncbi:hypothetical protein JCM33374_g203 [Metschnikowia sp. JCM 33374]|nr:hypothetical protein JCM33374_g203 [Metschnikowia sp. JCM 33374]
MSSLTAERLVKLAYKYPNLHNNWYIFASTALTVVNQPQEIGKVFHFALRQQLLDSSSLSETSLLNNSYLLKLAEDSIASAAKYSEFSNLGENLPDISISYSNHEKLPIPYKCTKIIDIQATQSVIAEKTREAILKIAPISGLPKSINSLTALKSCTPNRLKPDSKFKRDTRVVTSKVNSSSYTQENMTGISSEVASLPTFNTIEGPVSIKSINSKAILENTVKGSDFWCMIYGKIRNRVRHQLYNAYPDLWQYAYNDVYGSILSYTGVLDAKETSFCVICSLIPQDVNPTLKGHLKGALNVGATKEEIEQIRLLTFDICDWNGNIVWEGGQGSVAKL